MDVLLDERNSARKTLAQRTAGAVRSRTAVAATPPLRRVVQLIAGAAVVRGELDESRRRDAAGRQLWTIVLLARRRLAPSTSIRYAATAAPTNAKNRTGGTVNPR